ncbi:MAG TPA: hypothetical protein PKH07_08085, partial [bacterium]|nr:hypothetical protein [bacterium]
VGEGAHRIAYLRTLVWSPEQKKAQIEIGSDDGVKVWLNDEVVHSKNVGRGCTPGEDKARVVLKEGWNRLLVKVSNYTGGWGLALRIRSPKGRTLDGLEVALEESPK